MTAAADLAKAGCKYLGARYSDMDCQAFVERCLKDCGTALDLTGSNAWFRRMTWTGTPEDCQKTFGGIPRGAFLFILERDGKEPAKYRHDGIGNASHIGIATGMTAKEMLRLATEAGNKSAGDYLFGDGAIHSSATREHVATSTFRGKTISGGWNRVGLWSRLDYGPTVNAILSGYFSSSGSGSASGNAQEGASMEAITTRTQDTRPGTGTVNLRYYNTTGSAVLATVPFGQTVTVLERGDDWTKVYWANENGAGRTGYIQTRFLKFADADPEEKHPYTVTFTATEAEAQGLLLILDALREQLEAQAGRG